MQLEFHQLDRRWEHLRVRRPHRQRGRDTVQAVVWPMGEAEALLLDRSLRFSEHETALEQGWLLAEMEQRFGYGLDELARRVDRSVSWVSRRLALVELDRKSTRLNSSHRCI